MAIRKSLVCIVFITISLVIFFVFSHGGCTSLHYNVHDSSAKNRLIKIEGVYECTSQTYKGLTSIKKSGAIYYLNWKIGKQSYNGIGIRENNTLSSSWTNGKGIIGIAVYKIEPGPKLSGKYSFQPGNNILGTEILTFKDDLAPPHNVDSLKI